MMDAHIHLDQYDDIVNKKFPSFLQEGNFIVLFQKIIVFSFYCKQKTAYSSKQLLLFVVK